MTTTERILADCWHGVRESIAKEREREDNEAWIDEQAACCRPRFSIEETEETGGEG